MLPTNDRACPAVMVSAIASGQGKTMCTAALARAWRDRGYRVQAFKSGPDFIDPMVLEVATGRPVYNLDLGMCGLDDGQRLLYQAAGEADVIIVEGVMGLFDGQPSSADLAKQFHLPVLLTVDASAMAQTFGAVTAGVLGFDSELHAAGVIANKLGSQGHGQLLRKSLASHPNSQHLAWFGALLNDAALTLPERHLGLHLASEITDLDQRITHAAKALAESRDLPLPPAVMFHAPVHDKASNDSDKTLLSGKTIAVAKDAAFCFIYPANIDCLMAMGADIQYFSPLNGDALPEADAYWLPGGYPELHPAAFNQTRLRLALHEAHRAGKPILAECGGMMAVSDQLNGDAMWGLLSGSSEIKPTLQGLGTQHAALPEGALRGHTFHYGVFRTALKPLCYAESAYGQGEAVYRQGRLTASFMHWYFPSNPAAIAALLS